MRLVMVMVMVMVIGLGLVLGNESILVQNQGDITVVGEIERVVLNIIALRGNKYRRRVLF